MTDDPVDAADLQRWRLDPADLTRWLFDPATLQSLAPKGEEPIGSLPRDGSKIRGTPLTAPNRD